MSNAEPQTCCRCPYWLRVTISSLGIVAGASAAPIFAARYHAINATVWAIISVIFASWVTVIHVRYHRGTLVNYYPKLKMYMLTGCIGQLIGLCALASYLSLGGVLGQGISGDDLMGENYWIASVWGFMTWKWSFYLFYFSRAYRRGYEKQFGLKPIQADEHCVI